jgi:hypothetical protein
MEISIATTESSTSVPEKTIELPHDPVMHSKECKLGYNRATCTSMFTAALFTIAKLWKQPRCPTTDEWIKKM